MSLFRSESIGISAGTSGSSTDWIPMDVKQVPFNASFGVFVSGTACEPTFKVEHAFDYGSAASDVFTHADVTAAIATIDGNYAFPVGAVRLTFSSVSGSGRVRFYVRQSGP